MVEKEVAGMKSMEKAQNETEEMAGQHLKLDGGSWAHVAGPSGGVVKRYWIADADSGCFDGPLTETEAKESLSYWIADGITREKAMQDETGLTDEEIKNKVENFYSIVEGGNIDPHDTDDPEHLGIIHTLSRRAPEAYSRKGHLQNAHAYPKELHRIIRRYAQSA
ncbi:MAG: hypothetical protein HGB22_02700 [Chlorobiaceae bacterium]|nr:hypothetical protein [Chlorobiaceae bacterium]